MRLGRWDGVAGATLGLVGSGPRGAGVGPTGLQAVSVAIRGAGDAIKTRGHVMGGREPSKVHLCRFAVIHVTGISSNSSARCGTHHTPRCGTARWTAESVRLRAHRAQGRVGAVVDVRGGAGLPFPP